MSASSLQALEESETTSVHGAGARSFIVRYHHDSSHFDLGRQKRKRTDDLVKLARKLLENKTLILSHAFLSTGSEPRVWFFEKGLWYHSFVDGRGGASAVVGAIRRALCPILGLEASDLQAKKFIQVVGNIQSQDGYGVTSGTTFGYMRTLARHHLFLAGGCIDLGGDIPCIVRPTPKTLLFFHDEVMSAKCPPDLDHLGGHEDVQCLLECLFGGKWTVFLDLLIRTLRGEQHKTTAIITGPRNAWKSYTVEFLNRLLGNALCPVFVDSYMASESWVRSADTAEAKAAAIQAYGRSIIRLVDEADSTGRRIHYTSVKSEQVGEGKLYMKGGTSWRCVPSREVLKRSQATFRHVYAHSISSPPTTRPKPSSLCFRISRTNATTSWSLTLVPASLYAPS